MFNIIACFISGDNREYEESIVSILDEAIASQKSCVLSSCHSLCSMQNKHKMRDGTSVYYSKPRSGGFSACHSSPRHGRGQARRGQWPFLQSIVSCEPGLECKLSPASARLPRPPWERRLTPASASPFPSLAKTPEDGNNGGQGGLGWGKRESKDNPTNTHLWSETFHLNFLPGL